jgi:hypothetical protein
MVRLLILIAVLFLAFRFFLWLFRVILISLQKPHDQHVDIPKKTPEGPPIDPRNIKDAKFIDLPKDSPNKKAKQ